jgi:hypothetical protein
MNTKERIEIKDVPVSKDMYFAKVAHRDVNELFYMRSVSYPERYFTGLIYYEVELFNSKKKNVTKDFDFPHLTCAFMISPPYWKVEALLGRLTELDVDIKGEFIESPFNGASTQIVKEKSNVRIKGVDPSLFSEKTFILLSALELRNWKPHVTLVPRALGLDTGGGPSADTVKYFKIKLEPRFRLSYVTEQNLGPVLTPKGLDEFFVEREQFIMGQIKRLSETHKFLAGILDTEEETKEADSRELNNLKDAIDLIPVEQVEKLEE